MRRLTLYSRPGCHLCDVLSDDLRVLIGKRAELLVIDIDTSTDLKRRYGQRIPVVVAADGRELSSYPLDRARVDQYLATGTAIPTS